MPVQTTSTHTTYATALSPSNNQELICRLELIIAWPNGQTKSQVADKVYTELSQKFGADYVIQTLTLHPR